MGKVEEVAAAIRLVNETTEGLSFTMLSFEMARAAIEAMRHPTEVMLGAMNETMIEGWEGEALWATKDDCKSLFNAAIDAALSEDKEQG